MNLLLKEIKKAIDGCPQLVSILGVKGIGLGSYIQNGMDYQGKVIFAGGKHMSDEDKPRNIMGGGILPVEIFKVIMKGSYYDKLEEYLNYAKIALKNAGFIQISGFEHIDGESLPQLAVSFKSLQIK